MKGSVGGLYWWEAWTRSPLPLKSTGPWPLPLPALLYGPIWLYDWTTRIYFTKLQLSAAAVKSVQHTASAVCPCCKR